MLRVTVERASVHRESESRHLQVRLRLTDFEFVNVRVRQSRLGLNNEQVKLFVFVVR